MMTGEKRSKEYTKIFIKKITASLTAFFFYTSFLLIPSHQARADFKPLADPNSVAAFQALCEDMGLVINLTRTYRKLFKITSEANTQTVSGLAAYLADESDYIPKMCSLIMAVATASNTAGVLRAARIANQVAKLGLVNELDAIEDTIDIADFVQNLSKVKDSKDLKYKILNANNHARIIRYLQTWGGLTDGSDGVAEMGAALDAQGQMENLAGQLFSGCKVPLKKNQAPSNDIFDADGKKLSPQALRTIENKKTKALEVASEALAESNAAHKLLNKMIAAVAVSPEELRSDSYMVNKFRTEAIWLSFGFLPPQSTNKVGVDVVIQDCPKDEFRDTPRVKNGKLVICKQTSDKNAYYANQGSIDGAQCSRDKKKEYDATAWMVKNMVILADRYYNYQSLSAALNVCPYGGVEAALGEFTIGGLKPEKNEDLAEKLKEANLRTLEENCQKKDRDEQFKQLGKLGPIGTDQWSYNVDSTEIKCKPTRQQRADSAETVYVKNKNINNMRDLIKVYSERFEKFADYKYALHLTENPVSKGFRYVVGNLERGLADLSSSSSISGWDDQAGLRTTSNQLDLIRSWKQFSSCHRPSTLKRRYPDEYKKTYITDKDGQVRGVQRELNILLDKCLIDDVKNPSGKIFEETFYAMMDATERYFNAQKSALEVDLRMGRYRGNYSDKDKVVCEQALNITDINLATAQATIRMYEAFANAERRRSEDRLKEEADKKEIQSAQDEFDTILSLTTELKEKELKRLLLNKVDIERNQNPDFKGLTPSLMNQRKMEKASMFKNP
jgi:hypothetical protein